MTNCVDYRSDLRIFSLALLVARDGQIPLCSLVDEGNRVGFQVVLRLPDLDPVLRLTRKIWGAKRTLLLFISEQLRSGQVRGLEQHLRKRLKELAEWKEQLAKPRSGPRTVESAKRKIQKLVSGQFIQQVLKVDYHPDRTGADRLEYCIDQDARSELETEFFGKRTLMTNRTKCPDEEIMLAYRGQSHVEAVFRQLKDDEHLAVRPQHHWIDQKVHVHTFMCLLALLLSRVVEHGRKEGLSGILDLLARVRLAMVISPSGEKGGRPKVEWQLEDGNSEVLDLFRQLVPAKPPFVYTHGRG